VKFFLDENFPKRAKPFLEDAGYQVFDIRGTEFEGLGDSDIFKQSQLKEAIFLTTDRDFFHTIPFLYESHYGVVIITLSQPDSFKILAKLRIALEFLQDRDLFSRCLLLTDKRIIFRDVNF